MTTERQDVPVTTLPRWAGTAWFVAAGVAVVVAVVMLVTPVGAPARYGGAPGCGVAVLPGGGSDEYAQQVAWCVGARGERVTTALAVLAIGGFLVVPGLMRRSRRTLDGRTGGGLALLALATTLLLLPQSDEQNEAWCGSALIPGGTTADQSWNDADHRLAECAGRRSSRVAWALLPAVAGVLTLTTARSPRSSRGQAP